MRLIARVTVTTLIVYAAAFVHFDALARLDDSLLRTHLPKIYQFSPPAVWAFGGLLAGVLIWPPRHYHRPAEWLLAGYTLAWAFGYLATSTVTDDPAAVVRRAVVATLTLYPWLLAPLGAAIGRLAFGEKGVA